MYLLTAQELRQTLKLSERAYFRWINRGMPSIGYGHIRRFRINDVIAWLKQFGEDPQSELGRVVVLSGLPELICGLLPRYLLNAVWL